MTARRRNDPADEPFLNVLRPLVEAYLALLRCAGPRIAALGLTPAQFDVIVTLGGTDGFSCKDLAEKTLVTKGTLTGVLDRLEIKRLVERVPSKQDRRCTFIRLTPAGERCFRAVFPAHIGYLKPLFERALTAAEMQQLGALLRRLKQSFDAPPRGA